MASGHRVVAPLLRDGAIVPSEIAGPHDLPRGKSDTQSPGRYRVTDGTPGTWFEHTVGPQSWKAWLYPARERLWKATTRDDGTTFEPEDIRAPATVLFGVRACDLAALARLDAVFGAGPFRDPRYVRRREATRIIAVNCSRSASTCFCASAGTGPRAGEGYDLALTELARAGGDGFLLTVGSAEGEALLAGLETRPAQAPDIAAADEVTRAATDDQQRSLPHNAAAAVRADPDHPRWDDVAARCLDCGNCTLACPTCFCSDIEDVSDLSGDHAERWRVWDSCFSLAFSHVTGGSVRRSGRSRYRQWLGHKLGAWHEQYGMSGCVGCGRCIAWCPAGIDLTEEATALTIPAEEA